MFWQTAQLQSRLPALRVRQKLWQGLRHYFNEAGFAEVETPALQICPGLEVHLHPFATYWRDLAGGEAYQYWLHTSPELTMKKLLAGGAALGLDKIWQACRVFRNGEVSPRHQPEFVMLEWYRAHADYTALVPDCLALLKLAATAGQGFLSYNGHRCDAAAAPEWLTVQQAFLRYARIDLLATCAPEPNVAALAGAATKAGVRVAEGDSWEDLYFRILLEKIEPNLGIGHPTFLAEYPLAQAVLSRAKPDDARVAERFELYVCGLELANAFSELTDADIQRARFKADAEEKYKLYGYQVPQDEDFLTALGHMPPSAGIALGFERLLMLAVGADKIDDVVWAPVV